jgi:predicted AAA+ superfamily ATPase
MGEYTRECFGPSVKTLVSGPRQVGKTTLSKRVLAKHETGRLSWDLAEHREQILQRELPRHLGLR